MRKQLYTTLILFTLVLLFISQAYSLWYSKLRANFYVSVGELDAEIGSYKIISCCRCYYECPENYTSSADLSSNGRQLAVYFENVYLGWESYVGIVIANNGTLPAKLRSVHISSDGNPELLEYFQYDVMYFGSFDICKNNMGQY